MKKPALGKVKPWKLALWCVLGAIFIFVCVALGSLLVQKFVQKKKVPMFMGYAWLVVETPSMSGMIERFDVVIIKASKTYKPSDIVTFDDKINSKPTTHLVVSYDPQTEKFTTWGVANGYNNAGKPNYDLPISADQIYGKVMLTIPKLGLVLEWFKNDGGYIYLIAILAVVIGAVFFWNQVDDAKKTEAEGEATAGDVPASTETPALAEKSEEHPEEQPEAPPTQPSDDE